MVEQERHRDGRERGESVDVIIENNSMFSFINTKIGSINGSMTPHEGLEMLPSDVDCGRG